MLCNLVVWFSSLVADFRVCVLPLVIWAYWLVAHLCSAVDLRGFELCVALQHADCGLRIVVWFYCKRVCCGLD